MYELKDLKTDSLILRPMRLEYSEDYQKHFDDYRVIRYLSTDVPWHYPQNKASSKLKQKTGVELVGLMDANFIDMTSSSAELWNLTRSQWQSLFNLL